MTRAVLGIDASTTAVKAIAWSERGEPLAEGRAPLSLESVGSGGWEQDARAYRTGLAEAVRRCLAGAGGAIDAVAITHQRETFVLTDEDGAPRRPAITWMDARGQEEVRRAKARFGADWLRDTTGKEPCITPSLYKLAALYARDPAARALDVYDVGGLLLRWLTGERVTSLGSADPLGLVALERRDYSEPLLEHLGLSRERLPRLVEPGAVVGRVTNEAAGWVGLPAGLPVVAALGDGQCAGLGAGVLEPGAAYVNLGTALVAGTVSRKYVTSRACRTLYAATQDTWFLETDLKGGMFSVGWWVERVLGRQLADVLPLAEQVPEGADGLLFLPYLLGAMNPVWDDGARGALVGLAGHHGPGHVLRAILEGLAMEQAAQLDAMARVSTPIDRVVLLGGGAESGILTDALAALVPGELVRAGTKEATALGAGILAAVGAGWFGGIGSAVAAMARPGARLPPRDGAELRFDAYQRLYGRLAG